MKFKTTFIFMLLFFIEICAQNKSYQLETNYFYGSILPHQKNILHLIQANPEGVILSFNKKTFGDKPWHAWYNYPDYGFSFQYQNNKNDILGNLYGLYAHMNFYFFKRNLQLRVGQGIAYNTNPYNVNYNFKNVAYGAAFMPSTYFMLNYHKDQIYKNFGLQAGINFVHHSNANLKAPNTSTNTLALTVGLNYNFGKEKTFIIDTLPNPVIDKALKYSVFFRTGVCESDVPNSGAKPFYVATAMVDKKLNKKSKLQVGADVFWMKYLKEFIKYDAIVFYENDNDPDADYKRVGVFLGHELLIGKLGIDTQFGYYVYDPSKKQGSVYQRLGARYYFTDNVSGGVSLKTHMAQAEAMEFSIGYTF